MYNFSILNGRWCLLLRTLHRDLHWLDVTERIQFRVAATVYQCLHGMAPAYMAELCLPITASASRRGGLRSATTSNLVIPRCRLLTYGTHAFSVAGPVCWNSTILFEDICGWLGHRWVGNSCRLWGPQSVHSGNGRPLLALRHLCHCQSVRHFNCKPLLVRVSL